MLAPTGGTLSMQPIPAPVAGEAEDPLCADPRRDEPPDEKSPGGAVRFRPGAGPPNDPLARFLRTRRDTSPSAIVDTLQLGLGPFLESDFAGRLAVGSRDGVFTDFKPWFSVAGNGRVTIPLVTTLNAADPAPKLLSATGRLMLPPVKAIPTDSLFNGLLILGYIYGLRSISGVSQVVTITFPVLPTLPIGDPLDVLVHVAPTGTQEVKVKSAIAVVVMPGGTTIHTIVPPAPQIAPLDLRVQEIIIGPIGNYRIEVQLRLGIGNFEAAASATSDSALIIP
jgi:hypothetical protein